MIVERTWKGASPRSALWARRQSGGASDGLERDLLVFSLDAGFWLQPSGFRGSTRGRDNELSF